jgi:hypothetical protein
MITRIVKLTFKQKHVNEFLQVFEKSKEKIRSFEGCNYLELMQGKSKGNIFFTYSQWENETYLAQYRNSPLFRETWSKTKKLFAEKAEAWSLNQLHKSE